MAKHISYKIDGTAKISFKIHSSDASKTFWNDREPNLNFIEITDDQFTKIKRTHSFNIGSDNSINFNEIGTGSTTTVSKGFVKEKLDQHIEEMQHHVDNHEQPLVNQAKVDSLKNVNLDNITWPVTVDHNEAWVQALETNSISLDHIFEL